MGFKVWFIQFFQGISLSSNHPLNLWALSMCNLQEHFSVYYCPPLQHVGLVSGCPEDILVCLCVSLSCVRLFANPWTIAHQAPLCMEFSRHGSSPPRGSTQVSCIAGRFFTIWATLTLLMLLVCFSFFSLLFQLLWSFLLESFLKYLVLGYTFIFKNEMLKNCELSCTSGSWSVRELHHMIRKWLPIFVGDW